MTSDPRTIVESRNVFIDTSEFERLSYAFNSETLKLLCDHERINIVLPEVVISEVRDHLKKAAAESVALHHSFSRKARVLRNLGGEQFSPLFDRFEQESAGKVFEFAFDQFLQDAGVTILPLSAVDLEEVFRRYYAMEPPFESGKKKSEFPDALALEAVRRWATDNETTVYVVSCDQEMKNYCDEVDELNFVGSIELFLDMAVRQDEEAAERIRAMIEAHRDVCEERINQVFSSLGFYIDDREGDVEDVVVSSTDIQECLIVKLKDNVATVELYVTVNFTAEVSYDDLEHGIWDSETQSLWTATERAQWEREFDGTVRVRIRVAPANPESFSIEDVEINNGEDICLVYDVGWPYK